MFIGVVGEVDTLAVGEFDSPLTAVFGKLAVIELDTGAGLHILI